MTQLLPITALRAVSVVDGSLRQSLRRFVEGRLRHRADSEDVVQEIYVRLYDYERTRSIGNVGAFCFKVARNLVHDQLRTRRATGQMTELHDDIACTAPRADEILAYRERVDVLVLALKAMPALRREVFTRRRLEEQSVGAIARDLGMNTAAVEKHCSRALADLRSALDRRGLGLDKRA